MFRQRASAVPQAVLCAASAHPAALNIVSGKTEPSRMGDATHESQAAAVAGKFLDPDELAQKHRVDPDELGYLCRAGRKAWESISHLFALDPIAEGELSWVDESAGIVLTGHPDVFSVVSTHANLADWKSGFLWSDCIDQLRAYAWLLMQSLGVETVTAIHVNIRRGEIERFDFNYDDLAAWWLGFTSRVLAGREDFSPGLEACKHCPRWHECPAGKELAIDTMEEIVTFADGVEAIAPNLIVQAYRQAKFVIKIAEQIIDQARTIVVHEGDISDMDGRTLVIERQAREKIEAEAAWETIVGAVGMTGLAACSTIGKTKLLDQIKANAPRGQKGKVADAFMDELRGAGAVTKTFIEKLELRKAQKLIPNQTKEEASV